MKYPTCEIYNILNGITNRLYVTGEKISKLEHNTRNYARWSTKRRDFKAQQSISELWDNVKWLSVQVTGVSEGEEVNGGGVGENKVQKTI